MHTTTNPNGNPELLAIREQLKLHRLYLKLTMIRVQTKALQTLERLMDDPEPTGNEKADKAKATERNRQRLAANQTLIHCRTAEREQRLSKVGGMAMQRMAMQDAESPQNPEDIAMPPDNNGHQRLEPNRASDGWQASMKNMLTESFSPRGRRWSCADSAQDRMRGRPESSDDQSTPSKGAMVGAEGAGHADSSAQPRASHGLRPISDRTQTMPPQAVAPKEFVKPKHPRRSRRRKRRC